jgi:ABC-type uncharacterized transport system substrate-binding protein
MSPAGFWLVLAAALHPPVQAGIVVAYESGVDAYTEAMEGLQAGLGAAVPATIDLHAPGGAAELARTLGARDVKLVIAVGSRALAEVQARKPAAPVIAAMVLRGPETESAAGRVDLDIALATQLGAMRALLPRCTRVGILRNPRRSRYSAEALEARARKQGFTLVVVDCDSAVRLLKALAAFQGKVDFLLCFPDPDLYNPVTIKPLILASLEDRLPIVGFSPAFVRAGAVAGIYPDYRETGRQAAELALRMMRGEERAVDDGPAKVQVAVNQRVARLLGIEFAAAPFPVEVFR